MREIELTQGKIARVSDSKFEKVSQYKWYAHLDTSTGRWYARRTISYSIRIFMHRFILDLEPDDPRYVDHKDNDGLNNQDENIRVVTLSQNSMNRRKSDGKSSDYKGVFLRQDTGRWRAYICKDYQRISLGSFLNEEEAARAYDEAAKELFGEFAKLNFPDG